jgi:hypothetical protein
VGEGVNLTCGFSVGAGNIALVGWPVGYKSGLDDGVRVGGEFVGIEDGSIVDWMAVGKSDGGTEGIVDGTTEGLVEGIQEGVLDDGAFVGIPDGSIVDWMAVGESVGDAEGITNGTTEGIVEAPTDELDVGKKEGSIVGGEVRENLSTKSIKKIVVLLLAAQLIVSSLPMSVHAFMQLTQTDGISDPHLPILHSEPPQ